LVIGKSIFNIILLRSITWTSSIVLQEPAILIMIFSITQRADCFADR